MTDDTNITEELWICPEDFPWSKTEDIFYNYGAGK